MQTPSTYIYEQLERIISDLRSRNNKLFHQTKSTNISKILELKAIYSIGTLWGLDENLRVSLTGNNPSINAKNGFIDYIFLTNSNRFAHSTLSQGNARPKLYGNVILEIDLNVLLERDFFIYPFNTG